MRIYLVKYFIVFLLMLSTSNAFAVREITGSEKSSYSHIPIESTKNARGFKGDGCKDYGTLPFESRNQLINYKVTKNSYDASIECYVLGPGYHKHLRAITDAKAEKHCNTYNKHALYRGKGLGYNKVLKGLGAILSLGTSIPQSRISVSYVCDKNIDPKIVEAKKLSKEKADSEKFWSGIGQGIAMLFSLIVIAFIVAYVIKAISLFLKEVAIEASKRSTSPQSQTSQQGVSWSKLIIIVLIIIVGIFVINSFTSKPPENKTYIIEKSSPSNSNGGFYFDNNKFQDAMNDFKGLANPNNTSKPSKKKNCRVDLQGHNFGDGLPVICE